MAPWDFLLVAAKLLVLFWPYVATDCPGGWTSHGDSCYFFRDHPSTWVDAKVLCNAASGHLVEIDDAEENNFMVDLLKQHGVRKVWIGLEDIVVEGEFQWTTSQEMPEYTSWQDGQPSDSGDGEDCGEIFDDGSWNDVACDDPIQKRGFICERKGAEGSVIG